MNTLDPFIAKYLRERVKRGEISQATANDKSYRLARLSRSFGKRPIDKFGPKAIDRWLGQMKGYAPATKREHLSNARGFCRWLANRRPGLVDATAHVKPIRQPRRTPITLTKPQMRAVLTLTLTARDRAILEVFMGCGCRRVEVSRLNLEDYMPAPNGRGTLRLVGKAGHERVITVPTTAARALDAYLEERGRVAGPMFLSRFGDRLHPHTIGLRVSSAMSESGVHPRVHDGRSAHGLRRTAASDVWERSGNLLAVQLMLGHASINTTAAHYLRPVTLAQLSEAMDGRDYSAPDEEAA